MRNNETIPHIDEEYGFHNDNSSSSTLKRLRANTWANFAGGAAGGGTGSGLKAFLRFLSQSRVPFQRMKAMNHLVSGRGSTLFCLAEVGHHYVVYSMGGPFTLNVSGSGLTARWFDPRNPDADLGKAFGITPGIQPFTPPNNTSRDWVLWITDETNLTSGVMHPPTGAFRTQEIINRRSHITGHLIEGSTAMGVK